MSPYLQAVALVLAVAGFVNSLPLSARVLLWALLLSTAALVLLYLLVYLMTVLLVVVEIFL